jgi:transcriptional regulator of acetoin/glycerol metabolism
MEEANEEVMAASRLLRLGKSTMYRKLKAHGIR